LGFEEKPMQVMNPENTNSVILTAISIGVILLIVAMFLNVFSSLRQKNLGKALFGTSGLSGIVFYGAAIFAVVAEVFLGWHVVSLFYILGLIVLPFILIFFAEPLGDLVNGKEDWQPESWGGYIVENIFESIEVLLGYVTNTMSFLRIGVFVLVHAGMMLVVFTLAETAGGEFSIPYWIIIIFGNALVMALEALLVSIQVLRLEYYEMFNRFYSGEGRPFNPVKLNIE
ncbi:V-type ATPase 116kDa subunit family protein, partial [uncultured Ruminococcus sp.]